MILAADGGEPIRQTPFGSWPVFGADEVDAVGKVLQSGRVSYLLQDSEGRRFESEFAEFTGARNAVALANGTVALELALRSLGIGDGDEVVVPSRTFIATASAVVACGATPVIADVDRDTQNMTAETIEVVLSPRTRGIIVVHLAGMPCDMDPILALASQRKLKVVEDCAQALGATYKNKHVGTLGDAGCFSFCQDKILTTGGEGGMLITDDEDVWRTAWAYKDHGKSYDLVQRAAASPGIEFQWLHSDFGTNWRMTEMQAAIGRVALKRELPSWLARRRANAELLHEGFSTLGALRVPRPGPGFEHAYYKFYAFVRPEMLRADWDRLRVARYIRAEGIPCFTGSCSEIYLEEAFRKKGYGPAERMPVARELGETALMFLVHPTLGEREMLDACQAVAKVMEVAGV